MRRFGSVFISLLLSAIPATASDQNLKEEIGKIGSAYEQYFNNKGRRRDYFTLYEELYACY
ncbi:hypothetical protein ACVWW4_009113 [Bradyrhizobium sp. LB7.1]